MEAAEATPTTDRRGRKRMVKDGSKSLGTGNLVYCESFESQKTGNSASELKTELPFELSMSAPPRWLQADRPRFL